MRFLLKYNFFRGMSYEALAPGQREGDARFHSGGELTPGDFDALVRLGVGPQCFSGALHAFQDAHEVLFERVRVEQQRRRNQIPVLIFGSDPSSRKPFRPGLRVSTETTWEPVI